jgi:hypothetical protein
MIFLIDYDRHAGELIELRQFQDDQKPEAFEARLNRELALKSKGIIHEVVLLDAADENALRKTHRRYFENLSQLATGKTTLDLLR